MCNLCAKITGVFLFLFIMAAVFILGYIERDLLSIVVIVILTLCIFERVLGWFNISRTSQELLFPMTLLVLGMVSFNMAGQMAALNEFARCGVLVDMGIFLVFLTASALGKN